LKTDPAPEGNWPGMGKLWLWGVGGCWGGVWWGVLGGLVFVGWVVFFGWGGGCGGGVWGGGVVGVWGVGFGGGVWWCGCCFWVGNSNYKRRGNPNAGLGGRPQSREGNRSYYPPKLGGGITVGEGGGTPRIRGRERRRTAFSAMDNSAG